jgi:hypothetical protein
MIRSQFTFGVLAVLLLSLSIGSSEAQTCQDILDNNRYRCQFSEEGAAPFGGCFQFNSSSPTLSDKFDVQFGVTHGCTCKAKGGVAKPDFNASKEFLCVSHGALGSQGLEGKVSGNGKKIKNGFLSNNGGNSFVFECELDPTCV